VKKKTNIIEKTFLFSWPYAIIVSAMIFLITGNWDFVLSFVLGTFCGLMMNSMQYRIMKNAFEFMPQTIRSKTIMLYIFKMIFYAFILYFASKNPEEWNIYFVAGGILSYRIVLLIITIVETLRKTGDADGA
jgi:hypothetical protein